MLCKMPVIFQTTVSNVFCWMKMYEFRLKCHWSLFLWVQLTISQHWFRQWLGAGLATSLCLNQCRFVYWCIYASLGLNELSVKKCRLIHLGSHKSAIYHVYQRTCTNLLLDLFKVISNWNETMFLPVVRPGFEPGVSGTYSSAEFRRWKCLSFDSNFTAVSSQGSNRIRNGVFGIGFAPNRRRAIAWTNDDPHHCRINASPGLNEWSVDSSPLSAA